MGEVSRKAEGLRGAGGDCRRERGGEARGWALQGFSKLWQKAYPVRLTGVEATPEEVTKVCVDPKLQWSYAKTVWQDAGVHSMLYTIAGPMRWVHALKGCRTS